MIAGGTLLTMSPQMEIIEDSIIGIKDGIIVAVEKRSDQKNNELLGERDDRRLRLYCHARVGQHAHSFADGLFPGHG